jgi:hypothetical protein
LLPKARHRYDRKRAVATEITRTSVSPSAHKPDLVNQRQLTSAGKKSCLLQRLGWRWREGQEGERIETGFALSPSIVPAGAFTPLGSSRRPWDANAQRTHTLIKNISCRSMRLSERHFAEAMRDCLASHAPAAALSLVAIIGGEIHAVTPARYVAFSSFLS